MNCTSFSLPGVSKLYLAALSGDVAYNYNNDDVVVTTPLTFEQINFETLDIKQKRTVDQRGAYYSKTFELSVADFISTGITAYVGSNVAVVIQLADNSWLITGHEKAYSTDKYETENSGNDNATALTLSQNSYYSFQSLDVSSVTLNP
jgi:hypothetical protein